ncbi:MAG: hypothetical protein ACLS90_01545 [Clostridia bacterium]|jgi:hypothetical protein
MEENKKNIMKIGYEQTDENVEIDIYGIRFEIDKKKILEKDVKNVSSNPEKELEEILGKGSVEKINNKRVADGYEKMTIDVAVNVLSFVYASYIEATTNPLIDNIDNVVEKQVERAKNMYGENREIRRNYNRNNNYRRNRKYRRY